MQIPIYQTDNFTDRLFSGNPAAVCPLEQWLDDKVMQSIAAENNLSETAFFVKEGSNYRIRWFTPTSEVDLCGHATLASAYVYFKYIKSGENTIKFLSRSGDLIVNQSSDKLSLDFPATVPVKTSLSESLLSTLNFQPLEVLAAQDYMLVYKNLDQVVQFNPPLKKLKEIELRGLIVTAPGKDCEFVSRFFAPKYGIDEDPVTGSSHCALVPYWSQKLGKKILHAKQLSKRGGELFCEMKKNRVIISGKVVEYMRGTIELTQ
jgi:PhzF family phenazine biosynthesis protein